MRTNAIFRATRRRPHAKPCQATGFVARPLVSRVMTGLALAMALTGAASADTRVNAGVRAFQQGRYVQAASLLTPPARLGNSVAETYLGYMYQKGLGIPKDYELAAHWFHAAADQGEPTAQFCLAQLYDLGFGVGRDFVQAYVWFDVAAAHAPANRRDYWSRMRDAVASKLTDQELAQGQAQAAAFAQKLDP